MKHILFLSFLILFPCFIFSQPNIHKITWVGENNEYLNISQKTATLQKGKDFWQFDVVKYVKNHYIILSAMVNGIKLSLIYDIVFCTKDLLILEPKGNDFFSLSEPNKQNRYVFVNSMQTYKFVELYYETLFYNHNNPKEDRIKFILYIDSARNSRVVVFNAPFNEKTMFTAPPSKIEYESLLKILSSCDISGIEEEDTEIDKESPYEILDIRYNEQIKIFKGFNRLPVNFADKLVDFIVEYIELRANINLPWGWRVWIHR